MIIVYSQSEWKIIRGKLIPPFMAVFYLIDHNKRFIWDISVAVFF